ncbi:MarR family transcriptional regulator [Actinotalea sp. M2MS4P-6]|uniref:MarR family winged helix-turn-helix transcriptional regulator n=1 Tax=Actinotalea sp. M2MS4P-6 TaxID=2983762 RepID=UPI0021E39C55|nr:MarR family transcriptional regulator [Actinotalea sp. M2MS4P-6]MCV2394344.1 MarR family transcriptional regulator [Actinotalea sp. M2MS4P-6]
MNEHVHEPVPGPDVDPAEQLAHLVPALWRTMKRAARGEERLPANESQVTILRLVVLRGGLTPAQLADELHVARPTVSNLLKGLVQDNLVERRTGPHDARTVTIVPTDEGRTILETFRQDRTAAVRAALAASPDGERIDAGELVVNLRRLLGRLEALADPDAGSDGRTA